ncbi:Crp/Fnr family transcriptional regulator [Myxococcota bacterium]
MEQHSEQVGTIQIFSELKPEGQRSIARIATEETHSAGTRLFEQGTQGDCMYLILEGKIRVSRDIPGVGEEALAILGPGDVFGEMALLDDALRSADAWVHQRCRLLAIRKEEFKELLGSHQELAHEVLWGIVKVLVARLRETTDKLTFLSLSSRF